MTTETYVGLYVYAETSCIEATVWPLIEDEAPYSLWADQEPGECINYNSSAPEDLDAIEYDEIYEYLATEMRAHGCRYDPAIFVTRRGTLSRTVDEETGDVSRWQVLSTDD